MQTNSKQLLRILLKSSVLALFFLVACTQTAEQNVQSIDEQYGGSVNDYRLGLRYFDIWARETPMNQEELASAITQIETWEQEASGEDLAYLQFRKMLFESEKLYKSGSRRPFAQYDSAIRCTRQDDITMSVNEVKEAVTLFDEAVALYQAQEWDFMNANWPERMAFAHGQILERANAQEDIIGQFCSPEEQSEN